MLFSLFTKLILLFHHVRVQFLKNNCLFHDVAIAKKNRWYIIFYILHLVIQLVLMQFKVATIWQYSHFQLPPIITKYSFPIKEWTWWYRALLRCHEQNSTVNSVHVDDWTAELTRILISEHVHGKFRSSCITFFVITRVFHERTELACKLD